MTATTASASHTATKVSTGVYDYRGYRIRHWDTFDGIDPCENGRPWVEMHWHQDDERGLSDWDAQDTHRTLREAKACIDACIIQRAVRQPAASHCDYDGDGETREERLSRDFSSCPCWLICQSSWQSDSVVRIAKHARVTRGKVVFWDGLTDEFCKLPVGTSGEGVQTVTPLRSGDEILLAVQFMHAQRYLADAYVLYQKGHVGEEVVEAARQKVQTTLDALCD